MLVTLSGMVTEVSRSANGDGRTRTHHGRALLGAPTKYRRHSRGHFLGLRPVPLLAGMQRPLDLRALRIIFVRTQTPSIGLTAPTPGNTITPSCGFPQKSFPPEGPHDFRGHLRRSRKSDIAAEENSSADYATCRHAPRPKGEQRARGCVPCELRSALTFSPPVAARTSNKRSSCLSKLRIGVVRGYSPSHK